MVGVPRSKGCQKCVQRRMRCDEARPACANCLRHGVVCPGYTRTLKFVAGKHAVRPRGGGRRQQQARGRESSDSDITAAADTPSSTSSSSLSMSHAAHVRPSRRATSGAVRASVLPAASSTAAVVLPVRERIQAVLGRIRTLPYAPRDSAALFVGALVDSLRYTQPHDESVAFGDWIQGFASITAGNGKDDRTEHAVVGTAGTAGTVLLGTAVCAFALHLLGKMHRDGNVVAQSRTLYGRALQLLQWFLNHPTGWRAPEVLGASAILCFFELFAGTARPDSWMAHAAGVGRLIQHRGPRAYDGKWERSVLLAFRPMIIMNSLFAGQDCFLAQSPWQSVMTNLPAPPERQGIISNSHRTVSDTVLRDEGQGVVDAYFQLLAHLPTLMRYAYVLREARRRGEASLVMPAAVVLRLAAGAEQVRAGFAAWHPEMLRVCPPPEEAPTADPSGSVFPTILVYESPWMGSMHMGYWASMLIVQECLHQFWFHYYAHHHRDHDRDQAASPTAADDAGDAAVVPDFAAENARLARDILRSVECVGAGVMGAYRCGYGLRVAAEVILAEGGSGGVAVTEQQAAERAWLARRLHAFEADYAAISSRDYPPGLE